MPKVQEVNKLAGVLAPIRDLAPPYKRTRRSRRKGDPPSEPLRQSGDGAPPEIANDNAAPPRPALRRPPVRKSTRRDQEHTTGTAQYTPRALAFEVDFNQYAMSSEPDNNSGVANPRVDLWHLPGASDAPQTSLAPFEPDLITKDNDAVFAVVSSTLDSSYGSDDPYLGWGDSDYSAFLEGSILGPGYVLEGPADS